MSDFYQLDETGRAERIKPLAAKALEAYDITVESIDLITNETNCIFAVNGAGGERWVLRVTDPSGCHHYDEVLAEVSWLNALHADTDIRVNRPVAATSGELFVQAGAARVPEERYCVLFERIDGVDLYDRLNRDSVAEHGELMAQLHQHGAGYQPPSALKLRRYDLVFPYSAPGFDFHEPIVLFDGEFDALFRGRRSLVTEAYELAESTIGDLYSSGTPIILHNDLHFWNVMSTNNGLVAIDFEDALVGYPVQDIAVALFYYSNHDDAIQLMPWFRDGYERVLPWPATSDDQVEILMMARRLMLLNYCYVLKDPEGIAMREGYTDRTLAKLEEQLGKLGG